MHRRLAEVVACVGVLLAAIAWTGPARAGSPTDAEVKATFVLRFVQFVEWPRSAFAAPDAPLEIAVLGSDPIGAEIATLAANERVNGRPVVVRLGAQLADARTAQAVFVGRSEAARVPQILAALRGAPALTVADVDSFASGGGMIGFFVEDDRVRFEINQKAAERAGLTIPSRLLNLARIVASEEHP